MLFVRTMVMKTLVAFIVLLVGVSSSFAQLAGSGLINRVDRQVGEPAARITHEVTSVPASAQQKSFEITIEKPSLKLGRLDYGTISGHLKNKMPDFLLSLQHVYK